MSLDVTAEKPGAQTDRIPISKSGPFSTAATTNYSASLGQSEFATERIIEPGDNENVF
jgi:hypothetical protein